MKKENMLSCEMKFWRSDLFIDIFFSLGSMSKKSFKMGSKIQFRIISKQICLVDFFINVSLMY